MRRLLLILTREYLAHLLTPGFFVALVTLPLVLGAAAFLPSLLSRHTPAPKVAILDLTGIGAEGPGRYLEARIREGRTRNLPQEQAAVLSPPPPGLAGVRTPQEAGERIQAFYRAQDADSNPPILLVLSGGADSVEARLWTPRARLIDLSGSLEDDLSEWSRDRRMAALGLSGEDIRRVSEAGIEVETYSPESRTGRVTLSDRLPQLAALGVSYLLVSLILAGSGMILTSVVEEKSSRVIEVLVTSAHPAELLLGKVLGVLCLFLTVLGVLAGVGILAAGQLPGGLIREAAGAIFNNGLLGWATLFLVTGFLLYGSIFAGLAAFCETPREAQSLATPLSLMMLVPLILVVSALQAPESPFIRAAALFPPFTPFLMLLRIADGAPAWEVATGLGLMSVTTAGAIWVGVQAYRTGALAQGPPRLAAILRNALGRRA